MTAPPTRYDHVVWIVMENHSYEQIIGASDAPYINQLAAQHGLASNFYAESHPSLPNYIAMTSGSTQGIGDDDPPSAHPLDVPSIFSLLPGGGSRSLEESMPSNCLHADSGEYAVRHNPQAYYVNLAGECDRYNVPLSDAPDLSARFTFVTPNLIHDMHDGTVADGDSWLSSFVPKLLLSDEYATGAMAVFLTWDEDDDLSGNHIPTLVIAPSVAPGTTVSDRLDHFSMLRATQEMLGVAPLLGGAATAAEMRAPFNL
ncbi:MAG TPA: alkaline phosphatase family protein [Solirubrobacteraceae bacterium]|nr:alkaline phosphatase family protein [Solirubrobacteraceae bacterium]